MGQVPYCCPHTSVAIFAPVSKISRNAPRPVFRSSSLYAFALLDAALVFKLAESVRECALVCRCSCVFISYQCAQTLWLRIRTYFARNCGINQGLYLCLFLFLHASCYVLFAKFSYNARTQLIDFSVAKKCRTRFWY